MIGTRTLHVTTATGRHDVTVELATPRQTAEGWTCEFTIGWPDNPVSSRAVGNDGLEAALLAQQKIGVMIYMSRYHAEGRLSWRKDCSGYGFPVPKNGRDLLIGDDQRFYGLDDK